VWIETNYFPLWTGYGYRARVWEDDVVISFVVMNIYASNSFLFLKTPQNLYTLSALQCVLLIEVKLARSKDV
jgi:hypothetical protein